ncbi:MAG: hypothetical protein ABSG02_06825 [Terriglobales bacterium]|jgi:hypothetical protein
MRNALAKSQSPQSAEIVEGGKIAGALCQQVSKSELTLVEMATATDPKSEA